MDETKLLSYLKGELGDEEALQVESWCDAAPENRKILEQLYYTVFLGERAAAMDSVNVDAYLTQLKDKIKQKEKTTRYSPSIKWKNYAIPLAAFLTGIVFAVGFSFLVLNKTSNFIVATTSGQRAQFVLPDGSRVWLNSSTQLAYKTSLWSRERQVDLTGEAYFEVARNEHSPFIVNSKNVKVQVLGTKFDVRARAAEDRVVTTLLKGSVRVDLPGDNRDYVLKPEQILDVNTETLHAKLSHSSSAKDVLLWMDGKLKFKQATFEEITSCLEKHFDVHFIFSDEVLKKERFTCEFLTDNDITDILDVLSLTKHFQYKMEGKQVHLSFKK